LVVGKKNRRDNPFFLLTERGLGSACSQASLGTSRSPYGTRERLRNPALILGREGRGNPTIDGLTSRPGEE